MYDRRRRKKNPFLQRLGDVLEKTLKKRHISLPTRDLRIWEAWVQAVGPVISAQTSIDRLKHDVLFIKVSNSVWLQQLQFMKEEIIDKTNGVLGREAVKNIFFTIGHSPVALSKEDNASSAEDYRNPLSERDTRIIDQCTSGIRDPELSNVVKRVMTKDLKRRRRTESN